MNVNIGDVTDSIQTLVRSGAAIDRKRLADSDQPLEELVPAEDSGRPRGLRVAKQIFSAPARFVADRLAMRKAGGLDSLTPGGGAIVDVDGEKIAGYRDEQGRLHAVSPICTHLRCVVEWNDADRTWDCPCHGSRFDVEGSVLRGPAKKDLEPKLLSLEKPESTRD
jgi:3-phenylpropionate/trans-cinnamate dioxygenase ferredoxin reductase subunit